MSVRSIDDAQVGAKVEIKFLNSGADKLDPIFGTLTYVGADSVADERTGDKYYPIHAKLPESEISKQPELFLAPGLRAELYVISGERTAFSYLTQPIRDSFKRAFREE